MQVNSKLVANLLSGNKQDGAILKANKLILSQVIEQLPNLVNTLSNGEMSVENYLDTEKGRKELFSKMGNSTVALPVVIRDKAGAPNAVALFNRNDLQQFISAARPINRAFQAANRKLALNGNQAVLKLKTVELDSEDKLKANSYKMRDLSIQVQRDTYAIDPDPLTVLNKQYTVADLAQVIREGQQGPQGKDFAKLMVSALSIINGLPQPDGF